MHFFIEYGLFLAKAVTIVVAILLVVGFVSALTGKNKEKQKGKLRIKKTSQRFDELQQRLDKALLDKRGFKQAQKQAKQQQKTDKNTQKPRLFVLNFQGDIQASAATALREEVTAILLAAKENDRALVCIESPGGSVPGYGLAASQLQRLRKANIHLTVAVDKVAASGGYMMASVANTIIAAPFAIIGSIGVVMQLPNLHRYLEKKHIDFEQITAGEYKRTLTMFGENTKQGRAKAQQEIDDIHQLFKSHIAQHRPHLDMNKVATGEYWCAEQALALNLVDKLQTSDDYILHAKAQYDIYQINYDSKKSLRKRLGDSGNALLTKLYHPVTS